jgi:hypothetical protein
VVSISDAADALDLEIPKEEWDTLKPELEKALGGTLEFDIAELAG